MIKDIKIQNYKLFKFFSVKDLSQILLVGGGNNSGKTSFLEAIYLSLDYGNPGMFMNHFRWRGVDSVSNNAQALFAPVYHGFDLSKSMVFESSTQSKKRKIEYQFLQLTKQHFIVQNGNSIELPKEQPNNLGKVRIGFWEEGEKINEADLELAINGIQLKNQQQSIQYSEHIKAIFLPSTAPVHPVEHAHQYSELDKLNNTVGILHALQIIEPKLKSLSVISAGKSSAIYGDIGLGQKIHLSLMGQGIGHLLSILLAINSVKDGIVLIDELENGFHHSVLPRIWEVITRTAKVNNTQVIATTHSYELMKAAIESIPEDLKDDFKYIRIDKEENEFKTKQYRFQNLQVALENELEVR
ncbi:MAG: ATP-binding protein [Bdellovibrionales bacterium]|nr:ATP-binding protein [Bdellovibrionales bacterium]